MKKVFLSIAVVFLLTALIFTIMASTEKQEVISLWNNTPPTSNGLTGSDKLRGTDRTVDVNEADITIYLPDKKNNTGKAVIICPGGGYSHLAFEHEGTQLAAWLQQQGIAGIVLKYRLPNNHKEIPLDDVQQAFRVVRSKADEWGILKDKIGIAGSSAGGHLAATASTRFSSAETRPAFSVLFYPVVTTNPKYTHMGSCKNLLGENPSDADLYTYSLENQVNANTPPTLLLLSDDDKVVVPENSLLYYEALKKNGVPASMYIFPTGGHGWGMNTDFKYHEQMLSLLKSWLESI